MANTPQSYRFGSTAMANTPSPAGNIEPLNRLLADLSTRGTPKDGSALALRRHVEEEARALSGEAFSRFMDQLYDRITSLLESNDVADNLGALRATDELIDLRLGESGTKVSKFSNYMRIVFDTKRDPEILILASKVLGHLARAGGAMTADEVECQVKNALQWLAGERVEYRRFAAVLILKEMAENASTVFNVHVPEFVDAIWVALRDPTLAVRERAVEALRACLRVIEKRETRWRVQWYYRMFEATQDGLGKNASVHSIHGSLLAVGELLRRVDGSVGGSGRWMDTVRFFGDGGGRRVFGLGRYWGAGGGGGLTGVRRGCRGGAPTGDRRLPLDCLSILNEGFVVLVDDLVGFTYVYTLWGDGWVLALVVGRGNVWADPPFESFGFCGRENIAKAMGPAMETHVRSLLDAMFSAGLSSVLVEALEQVVPPMISRTNNNDKCKKFCANAPNPIPNEGREETLLTASNKCQNLVDRLWSSLHYKHLLGHDLLEFARESVVVYLEDDDGATRKDAALCCLAILSECLGFKKRDARRCNKGQNAEAKARASHDMLIDIASIVEKLLIAAVADADVCVRNSIFSSLHGNGGFDDFLAQADSLTAVFAALNDEDLQVREYAISVAGRLSEKNPAYVFPALRRHLIQLLTYLGQSADSKCREESAKLLGCLIRSCERLILPYIAPIHKALLAKLCEGTTGVNANNGIISGVLVTVGDLARVGGFAMREYIPELMPRIVEALLDGAAATKREVAVSTLGQVVQSTGYVITPYNEYPQLLGLLLKLLNGELAWSTRREVLKVLGIMGALDPHVHKRNQQSLPGPLGDGTRTTNDAGPHIQSSDELPMDLWPSFATSEDYFSTVAINSLIRILRDPSLSSYHQKVVGSLMFIFKSMGLGCVPYLPKVLPDFFHTIRTCEDSLKEFITWKLGTLVSIVRQHIRKYLPELLSLIAELWSSFSLPAANRPMHGPPILHLVEQLCLALNDEFRRYLPIILPCCIQVLSDAERCNDYTYVRDILRTLEVFGGTLDEHMHLLLPALIRLFKVDASVDIRRAAIKTLIRLIPRVQVTGHISALVHHLKLVLDGKNDELRKDAVDALCCLAHALGEDFTIFIPSIRKLLLKHRLRHKEFEEVEGRLQRRGPLILASVAAQKSIRQPPVEVISDPLSDMENDPYEDVHKQPKAHQVNDARLRAAGEASQRSTKEDWAEWMRHFSIELLKESPSPALRTCARLAQLQPFVGRELFAAGFVSCWSQLHESSQKALVRSLEMAFSSPNIPPEILATLLNLAEFMEHDEKPLPIDIRLLGALAEKCRAFAKALHYKEMEFEGALSKKMDANPVAVVEALIHINNQLHQHEAAVGILTYAQQRLDVQLKESWYEKLQRWDDALKAYTAKSAQASSQHLILDATLGRMRSLAALARWEELNNLCREYWTPAEPAARLEMAPMAASAAWNMGEWDQMAEYVSKLDDGDETKLRVLGNTAATGDGGSNGTFFRAVLLVRRGKYDEAREYVERARKCLATELAALVLESYERAYSNMVRVQQLSELEEVIDYCTLPVNNSVAEGRRALIRNMWNERIKGTKRNVEVWQALLAVRSLVLPPTEDSETWLKFASLCRKSGRISQAKSTLIKLLQFDPETTPETVRYHGPPQVMLAYLKYQWSLGEDQKRKEAFARLQDLAIEISSTSGLQPSAQTGLVGVSNVSLMARVYLKLGTWQWALSPGLDDESIQEILSSFRHATHCATKWAKAWHTWALFNTAVMSHYTVRGLPNFAAQFVVAAVTGYFHSIACAAHAKGVDDSLQDILRLLTLWFNHGATAEVQTALQRGFSHVNINTWLVVLPQIIARIHSNNHAVRELIQSLLVRIGQTHPQALMYPLLVACKSISNLRKAAAQEVVDKVRQHSGLLVDQAQLVSEELIRVAILWHEMWHEALEEASRLYFGEHNIEGMLKVLEPLHEMLEEGAMRNNTTIKEKSFIQISSLRAIAIIILLPTYHHELLEAYECCMEYKRTGKDAELTRVQ
ncbi:serine/threonine-protein kinase TOR [Tanacetum coccineum]